MGDGGKRNVDPFNCMLETVQREKGTDDGRRNCRGNQLRGGLRQSRPEMTPPDSVTGPPLTEYQIQCIRQIDTDTAQSSGSRVLSDTVPSSGL